MDGMQILAAAQALRDLLDNPERSALIKVIETGEPMTRRNARVVAEYLREAQEHAIRAATAQAGATPPVMRIRETG